ncbi:MAG: hypothetical protein WA840_09225 [Caulobacteraceae bacterium]
MRQGKFIAMGLLLFGLPGLAACGGPDWRTQVIAQAEGKMRSEVDDPSAAFSRVQVTGDDKTGQTCGFVTAKVGLYQTPKTGRFIVYIDQTAGPFVEAKMGHEVMDQDAFDGAWQADCVKEGYNA